MAVSPMQIAVSSCVVFFSYMTERVPATLRYGWINFSNLSLFPLLWLSLFLLVTLDVSFSLAFSICLCLPLSRCASLFCFLSLLSSNIARCIAVPALPDAPRSLALQIVHCLSLCCHTYSYIHTDECQFQRETQRSLSCLREGEEK